MIQCSFPAVILAVSDSFVTHGAIRKGELSRGLMRSVLTLRSQDNKNSPPAHPAPVLGWRRPEPRELG
jgi:hypothetical protein